MRKLNHSWLLVVALLIGLPARPGAAGSNEPGALADTAQLVGFEVGAAIDDNMSDAQLEIGAREFTSASVENQLKWGPLSPAPEVYDFSRADPIVDWAEQNGLRVRGHTLFWDRLNGSPAWLRGEVGAAPDPVARLTELMELHVQTIVGRYAGRLAHWDVVNEPLATLGGNLDPFNFFFQTLGEGYIDLAFHAAHAADPEALLFLNETLVEFLPGKFEGLVQLVERLLARGVPIHGVGLQGHFVFLAPNPVLLQDQLQRVADLGLLVELTEVDIPLPLFAASPDPLAAQGQAYANLFAACLAVPACTGITTWGIDDGDTWLDTFFLTSANAPNRPLLFDADGVPKPAYDRVVAELETLILDVDLDVKPGDSPNPIDPSSRGVLPVAILGSDVFDVFDVDPATLTFGPAGAGFAHGKGPHYEDVDEDGWTDLLAHHRTQETGIEVGDVAVCASGRTFEGAPFRGCDSIVTVPACGIGIELPLVLMPLMALHRRRRRRPRG